jgi:hypothetical protein
LLQPELILVEVQRIDAEFVRARELRENLKNQLRCGLLGIKDPSSPTLLPFVEVVQFLSIVFAWLFCASLQLIEPKQVLGENHETGLAGCSA